MDELKKRQEELAEMLEGAEPEDQKEVMDFMTGYLTAVARRGQGKTKEVPAT